MPQSDTSGQASPRRGPWAVGFGFLHDLSTFLNAILNVSDFRGTLPRYFENINLAASGIGVSQRIPCPRLGSLQLMLTAHISANFTRFPFFLSSNFLSLMERRIQHPHHQLEPVNPKTVPLSNSSPIKIRGQPS